jgi:hypothetical protein
LNHEISIVSTDNYEWSLLDVLNESLKLVVQCFDQVCQEGSNSRVAIDKLKNRMVAATTTTKTAIKTMKASSSSEESL